MTAKEKTKRSSCDRNSHVKTSSFLGKIFFEKYSLSLLVLLIRAYIFLMLFCYSHRLLSASVKNRLHLL